MLDRAGRSRSSASYQAHLGMVQGVLVVAKPLDYELKHTGVRDAVMDVKAVSNRLEDAKSSR